jgi:hypothetical protein
MFLPPPRYGTHYLLFCYHVFPLGPCHHGMVGTQVTGVEAASDRDGSWEYIEQTVADSRHGVVLQLGSWARC